MGICADDPEMIAARVDVMRSGPVPAILDAQYPDGYWIKPGPIYSPKYRATVWQVIFLAHLGADGQDERVRRAVEYIIDRAQAIPYRLGCSATPAPNDYTELGNHAEFLGVEFLFC